MTAFPLQHSSSRRIRVTFNSAIFAHNKMDIGKFLIILPLLLCFSSVVLCIEEFSCEVFEKPDIEGDPLLSLIDLDIIYDLALVLDNATLSKIKAIRLKPNCKLLSCLETKLKGKCSEYSETISNFEQDMKSVACKCSTKEDDSSVTLKRNHFKECGTLYENWYYTGDRQNMPFPGSVVKLEIGPIASALVNDGCKITAWLQKDDKMLSLNLEDSNTYINNYLNKNDIEDPEKYDWSCCHCDANSEKVCENAKNVTLQRTEHVEEKDFSQFVKHGQKIIGIGRNYRWKVSELTKFLKVPEKPIVFLKPSTSYISEGQNIQLPESLGTIYYELELGVVIGKQGKSIPTSSALDHVAGFFLALDMTAKEFLQKSITGNLPWEIGKGFDTACPVSHFIPKHLVPDPDNLDLSTLVNGKQTQSDNTKNMIFNVSTLINYVSRYMTLQPFDTILTGTPDGLGPVREGDVIEGTLGNLTTIRFNVVNFKDV